MLLPTAARLHSHLVGGCFGYGVLPDGCWPLRIAVFRFGRRLASQPSPPPIGFTCGYYLAILFADSSCLIRVRIVQTAQTLFEDGALQMLQIEFFASVFKFDDIVRYDLSRLNFIPGCFNSISLSIDLTSDLMDSFI